MENEEIVKGICPVCGQTVGVLPEGIATFVCPHKLARHPESPLHDFIDIKDPNNYKIKSHINDGWACKGGNCSPEKILV